MSEVINVDVDTSDGEKALASFAQNIRKVAEVGILTMQAFGINIDVVFQLGIQTGLRVIELITASSVALAAGTLGASTLIQLGAQAAAITLMIAQINAMTKQRAEAAAQLGAAASAFRIMTY